eukprot:3634515-Rhodomonas_salina.1
MCWRDTQTVSIFQRIDDGCRVIIAAADATKINGTKIRKHNVHAARGECCLRFGQRHAECKVVVIAK